MVNYANRGRTTATIFQDASIDGLVMPLLELLKGGEVSCYKSIPRFEYFKVRFSAFAKKDMIIDSLLACMDPLLLDLLLACMDPLYSWFLVWIKYLYGWIHLFLLYGCTVSRSVAYLYGYTAYTDGFGAGVTKFFIF